MPTILRDDQQSRVDELIRQGVFSNESAVIDEALSLLESRIAFRTLVQEGTDAVERGEIFDHDSVMKDVRQRIADVAAGRYPPATP